MEKHGRDLRPTVDGKWLLNDDDDDDDDDDHSAKVKRVNIDYLQAL
jgi:hypothetical protein